MAKRMLTPLGIVSLSSDPASGSDGQVYFNTTSNSLKIFYSGVWNAVVGSAPSEGSVNTDVALSNSWWLGV